MEYYCKRCLMQPHKGDCEPFRGSDTIKLTGAERAAGERAMERGQKRRWPMDPGDMRDLWKAGE